MKKVIKIVLSMILMFVNFTVALAQENVENIYVAFGASLDENQKQDILNTFGNNNIADDNTLTIDGTILNQYLNDGSDANTTVFSSAYVEFLPEGSGVQVEIVTPGFIAAVPQKTYENAAIAAGAKDALIQIAAPQSVTGEGALAGVYEIFKVAGMELDSLSISTAENQIKIEQLLIEDTDLDEEEVSNFISKINLEIMETIEENPEVEEAQIQKIVLDIIDENNFELEAEIVDHVTKHALAFAQSPVAKDPETKQALQASLGTTNTSDSTTKAASFETDLIGKTIKFENVELLITDIYLTSDRDTGVEPVDHVMRIEYDVTYTGNEDYLAGHEIFVTFDGESDPYYLKDNQSGKIGPNESIQALSSYGFNGIPSEILIEIKDMDNYGDSQFLTLEVDELPEIDGQSKVKEDEEVSQDDNNQANGASGKKYTIGNVDINIKEVYLTDERNSNSDDTDNVLRIEYDVTYNGSEDYYAGYEFDVIVNGQDADLYNLDSDIVDKVGPGETVSIISSYNFEGNPENIELEINDMDTYKEDSIILKISNLPK